MATKKTKKFDFLGGGLVTRPDDHWIDLLNSKGQLYSPDLSNVQFGKIASIQKRLGYSQEGTDVEGANTSIWQSQTTNSSTKLVNAVDGSYIQFYYKFTAASSNSIEAIKFNVTTVTAGRGFLTGMQCFIQADSGGNPATLLATSANEFEDGYELPTSTFNNTLFYFPAPVPVTIATSYWVLVQMFCQTGAAAAGASLTMRGNNSTVVPEFRWGINGSLSSSTVYTPYSIFFTGSRPVLGIYDYRVDSGGSLTQIPLIACNGTLFSYADPVYTSIKTGLASTVNSLYDFATLKNYVFICDYGTNNNQVWDGAASATMTHGYRGTFSLAQSASAGGPWSAAGIVQVMLATALVSGGIRCSAVGSITLAGTTNKIDLSSITVDAIAAQFSFDIAATATTVYCTLPNGSIFYKVPAASLSTAGNPIANTQTANSILPMTDATLTAGGSFETNTGYPQGYATGQVATPKAKYLEVFQNMLAMAGDPNNPSRVWLSEQFAPQVWGNGDSGTGIQGDFLDIAVDDGETVTGLLVSDGALLVGKQNSIYRVDFTGNAVDSYIVSKVHGQVGVLSNWSMQVIPEGMFFLSMRGPAICYGTYSDVLPQTRLIQNLFNNASAESFELSSMIYSVACNDTTRNQVLMTVSSSDSTARDRILSYDYEQKMFTLYDGYQANYIAIVGDSNGFPVLWHGNLSGQVFSTGTNHYDNGSPILMRFSTPFMDLNDPSMFKQIDFIQIGGEYDQGASNLIVDIFLNYSSTIAFTILFDQNKTIFNQGLAARIGAVCKSVKFRFRVVDYSGNGSELHWLRLEYADAGGTRLG